MFGFLAAVAWLVSNSRPHFGGEDPALGNPWYHEDITFNAARAAGWSAGTKPRDDTSAAAALAWHTDYVDSYLVNPFWWAAGGIGRFKAALLDRSELVKVHFDDLTSTRQIRVMWLRYLGGTVAGLVWAAGRNDVAAARHVIGVGLHALQDFYSHSNWVDDPTRRTLTWFDAASGATSQSLRTLVELENQPTDGAEKEGRRVRRTLEERMVRLLPLETRQELALASDQRDAMHLFTGSYEHASQFGFKDHGRFAFDCALLRTVVGPTLMNAICTAISPASNTSLCRRWRECTGATPARPDEVLGVRLPENVVFIEPPGIALDSTWMADISRQQRDLADGDKASGATLFDAARTLATRHTTQWLETLEDLMTGAGFGAFWQRVKTEARTGARRVPSIPMLADYLATFDPDLVQYEDAGRMAFTFLSAGTYPPSPTGSDEGWFLRLELQTANEPLAGTDAEIFAEAGGKSFLLNHMHGREPGGGSLENRLLEFNDFEAGKRTAYVIGPFAHRPTQLVLRNRAAKGIDVVAGAWEDLKRVVSSIVDSLGSILLSLIGGHADFVGADKETFSWSQLEQIANVGSGTFTFRCDGKSEGNYKVEGRVAATRTSTGIRASVRLTRLDCVTESTWDRASNSDEPFVIVLVNSPVAGQLRSHIVGPFTDVDTGDHRAINMNDLTVDVPRFGGLIIAGQVWESDDEGATGRQKLLTEFASRFGGAAVNERSAFLDAVGRAIAPDWKPTAIDVFAFRRGAVAEVAHLVKNRTLNTWVGGGESLTVAFDAAPTRSIQLPATV